MRNHDHGAQNLGHPVATAEVENVEPGEVVDLCGIGHDVEDLFAGLDELAPTEGASSKPVRDLETEWFGHLPQGTYHRLRHPVGRAPPLA